MKVDAGNHIQLGSVYRYETQSKSLNVLLEYSTMCCWNDWSHTPKQVVIFT